MQRAKAKAYLSKLRRALPAALPAEELAFRRLAPNDLGGWNTYSTLSLPGIQADLGIGIDSFLSGDPHRLRLWMALYFTRRWDQIVARAFKNSPQITDDDIVDGKVLHVAQGAAPDRFNLLRESIFGGTWISRYLGEGSLPKTASLASQVQRFLGDTRAAMAPFIRVPRAVREGKDLVQGEYWVRKTDHEFRKRQLQMAGNRCQACGYKRLVGRTAVIDLHHIKPMADGKWRTPKPSSVLVLCPNCHRVAHTATPPMGLAALTRRVASK